MLNSNFYREPDFAELQGRRHGEPALASLEQKAWQLYQRHYDLITRSPSSRRNFLENTPEVIADLNTLWQKTGSEKILSYLYHLNISYFLYKEDYQKLLDASQQTASFLAGKDKRYAGVELHNRQAMAYACLKLKEYDKGLHFFLAVDRSMPGVPLLEVSVLETYFMLALRTGNVELAVKIADDGLKVGGAHKSLLAGIRWSVLLGYLYINQDDEAVSRVVDFKKIRDELQQPGGWPSLNVIFNILEMSCLVMKRRFPQALLLYPQVEEALRKYKTGNVSEAKRLEWFRGLLGLLINNEFNFERISYSASRIFGKLKTSIDPYSPTEILPFNDLGKRLLDSCASR